MTLNELAKAAHENAKEKGFWEDAPPASDVVFRNYLATKLALIHSEVSEALEVLRKQPYTVKLNAAQFTLKYGEDVPKPEGFGPELADIIIRVMDLAVACGIDLEEDVERKMKFNATRPYKHGRTF